MGLERPLAFALGTSWIGLRVKIVLLRKKISGTVVFEAAVPFVLSQDLSKPDYLVKNTQSLELYKGYADLKELKFIWDHICAISVQMFSCGSVESNHNRNASKYSTPNLQRV